jgi:hypothetical protein
MRGNVTENWKKLHHKGISECVLLAKYYQSEQINEDYIGGTLGTYWGKGESKHSFDWNTCKKEQLGRPRCRWEADILRKYYGKP